jgi:hypothetical protein
MLRTESDGQVSSVLAYRSEGTGSNPSAGCSWLEFFLFLQPLTISQRVLEQEHPQTNSLRGDILQSKVRQTRRCTGPALLGCCRIDKLGQVQSSSSTNPFIISYDGVFHVILGMRKLSVE